MKHIFTFLLIGAILLSNCGGKDEPETPEEVSTSSPNILLIIADDMGKDATNGFSEGMLKPSTPNVDAIRNEGISFNNFWVYPTCSPTRASIITGKYGYSTGVKWADNALSTSETVLHKFIKDRTNNEYATALVGKWHLSENGRNGINPETFGIDYYAGLMIGTVQDYYNWDFYENGQSSMETTYTTTKFTDLAIDWILAQDQPWFLWLAYNAPHTPFHVPPSEMHSQGDLPEYTQGADALPYFLAAIEAMDYQIGRLLESIPESERENTVIIFLGDNGSPGKAAQSPYSAANAKGTLKQGGINMPLFISGPGITRIGETDSNLITGTDLFTTIAEAAGVTVGELNDSKSFKTLFTSTAEHRDFQYSEMDDGTNNLWTISNGTYKLITGENKEEELYDLGVDPYEANNLANGNLTNAQFEGRAELEEALSQIRK